MLRRIAISFLLVTSCLAQDNISRMDQVVHGYTDSKMFMGSVLVARDGKVLLSKGYGFADMEWDVPNSPTTKFRLGSVAKQFTAACVLLLEERGKLKLDDPVKKYMTDAPAAWDKITIFNLLTHTSGIPDYGDFYDFVSTEAIATTPEKLIARFRDRPLEFPPGEKYSYSNSGYVLLGYLIEKITQQNYSQFVQENIFNPLGMKDSGYDSSAAIIPHRASGYAPSAKGVINAGYIDMSVAFPGGLYSTTEDLLRWEQGLMGDKLLSPASLQKMTTPFKNNYALGVGVNTVNGHKVISHTGSIEGFYTELQYYPEDKLTVVVLANLRVQTPEYIARKLAAVAHGENVPLPTATKEITVSPAVLESYVGTYELKPSFNIVVTLEDGQLMMQATVQPVKDPLFAESETKFFLKVVGAQLEFFKNEKGEVTHLMLHQNGRDIKGIKKSQFSATYFLEQGSDYYNKGDFEKATQNFNEAIGLDTKSAAAFNGRGAAYFAKGDYGQAIQDFSEVISFDPKTPAALLNRGRANIYTGHFSDAQQDLSQNLQLDPTDPYGIIWLYLSRAKAGTDGKGELKANAAGLDLSKWPGPVIQLYLGEGTPEGVLRAAGSDSGQKCEYSFYVGEYRILRGERPQALALFRSARDGCPQGFVEYVTALIELKDLEKQK